MTMTHHHFRTTFIALMFGVLASGSFALDQVNIGSGSGQQGGSAVVPVAIVGTGMGTINLVTATISSDPVLGTPTVAPGAGQPNLLPGDAFIDALSPGVYRVTCFVRTTPNMQSGGGALLDLTYSLTGVPINSYTLTLSSSGVFDVFDAEITTPGTNGLLTVNAVPVELSAFSLE